MSGISSAAFAAWSPDATTWKTGAKLEDEMMKHGKWELLLDFFGKLLKPAMLDSFFF
jgi:hypothetical protein